MKYVISDKGEVNIGENHQYHMNLAKDFKGKVVAAGYCEKTPDNTYRVFGQSIGFDMMAQPEDATILNNFKQPI